MARILHIEDDPNNRRLVQKLLGAAGHEVIEAEGGLKASNWLGTPYRISSWWTSTFPTSTDMR